MLFIGDSVQKIHLYTFDTVQTAFSKNTTPPVVDCYACDYSGSNSYSYVTNAKIFTGTGTNVVVPCGSLSAYQSQYAWSNNSISDDCVNVVGAANNDSFGIVIGGSTCSPNTPLTLYALPSAGYTFVGWTDNNYDNPRNVVSVAGDIVFTAIFSPKDTVILHDTTIVQDTLTQYLEVHDTTYIDVHDTTYIDVPYVVHDTTVVVDTLTLTEYVPVHDTTTLTDTLYLPVYVHDTTVAKDTIYLPVYLHDTSFVAVHDTTYLTDTLTLTEYVPVHDTTYYPVHDTTYVTMTDTVTLTQYDTIINTVYDTVINAVYDTIDNFVFDTTTVYQTDTLWLYDTVYLHDTIYIYDTVYVGVDGVDAVNVRIFTSRGHLVVEGAEGNLVMLFDINGRLLATKQDEYSPLQFTVPASGAYLVKVGSHPARRVVVIR